MLISNKDQHYKIPIPPFYIWLANGNRSLFVRFVKGYLKNNYIEYKPLKIIGSQYVLCEKIIRKG